METSNRTAVEAIMGAVIAESNLLSTVSWRLIVDIYDNPIDFDPETDDMPKTARTTCGQYAIKYVPLADKFRRKNYPYVLINDLTNTRICLCGYKHLHDLAKEIPEVAWILRNTNYDDELFHVAAIHPGIKIPFSINAGAYAKKVTAKAKDAGVDVSTNDFKPFISYECSKEKAKTYFRNKKAWTPSAAAYLGVIAKYEGIYRDGE